MKNKEYLFINGVVPVVSHYPSDTTFVGDQTFTSSILGEDKTIMMHAWDSATQPDDYIVVDRAKPSTSDFYLKFEGGAYLNFSYYKAGTTANNQYVSIGFNDTNGVTSKFATAGVGISFIVTKDKIGFWQYRSSRNRAMFFDISELQEQLGKIVLWGYGHPKMDYIRYDDY